MMLEEKRIKKPKKMLEIERKIGEPIEIFLRREYFDNKKSAIKIGVILGVGSSTIRNWLKEAGMRRRDLSEARFAHFGKKVQKPSKKQLRKWYVKEKKSAPQIGKITGVSKTTVLHWLEEFGIKRRDSREVRYAQLGKEVLKPSDEQLHKWYVKEKMSASEITEIMDVGESTVLNWLEEAEIPRRQGTEAHTRGISKPSKEQLRKWYLDEKKSANEIGRIVGVSVSAVCGWLDEVGIDRRTGRERIFTYLGKDVKKPTNEQLRKWYIDEKKSTIKIGEIVGVGYSAINSWLKEAGIEIRDLQKAKFASLGKEIQKPADELLRRWYIDERKSTYEIAEIIGISRSTISNWLEDAGVQRRDDREQVFAYYDKEVEKPSDEQLRKWYVDEKKSTSEIGEILGVNGSTIVDWLKEAGIEPRESLYGYKEWLQCEDGHEVRSGYERRVDNWLHFNGIVHSYDKELPGAKKYRYDFRVSDLYIEVWGLTGKPFYDKKMKEKIAYYKKHGLKHIDIFPNDDFGPTNDYVKKLEPLLKFSNPEERVQRFLKDFDQ